MTETAAPRLQESAGQRAGVYGPIWLVSRRGYCFMTYRQFGGTSFCRSSGTFAGRARDRFRSPRTARSALLSLFLQVVGTFRGARVRSPGATMHIGPCGTSWAPAEKLRPSAVAAASGCALRPLLPYMAASRVWTGFCPLINI